MWWGPDVLRTLRAEDDGESHALVEDALTVAGQCNVGVPVVELAMEASSDDGPSEHNEVIRGQRGRDQAPNLERCRETLP